MKKFGKTLALGVLALFAALGPAEARAGLTYGVSYSGDQLFSMDTNTGVGTAIGTLSMPIGLPFGLSYGGGNLYTFDSANGVIRLINTATAATQNTYTIGLAPGALFGQGGLAFQNASVGFVTSALDPSTFAPVNDLYTFNIITGTSTLIAHTSDTLEALAFSPAGSLYGLGKNDGDLYKVNTTTGALTLLGQANVAIGGATGGLTFAPNGTLYATINDALYTLNTTTGAATPVTGMENYGGFSDVSGLAFNPASVPEPSSLVLGGIALASAVGHRLVRRRRAS